ncbi:hypothetical protein SISNIDRAFT_553158 [Sistotremastrum niveocremeum HHB9708]|uniref:Capsular associated protein n=1 Tax=Sistotremastrum niveocremeum HHB9708 TaxID=1314777 RepID=A0A164N988_9AGAM|nr:hypothetical protein SISNIDRAFT_553158 [Sistotremastrum niveocremeum HHB9708]
MLNYRLSTVSRVVLTLPVIIVILFLQHSFLSSNDTSLTFGSSASYSSKAESSIIPPSCQLCSPDDLLCDKYGSANLARSRAYEGPNARLRRVLRKAHSGQPIKIGILGGSVSAGHGVPEKSDVWHAIYAQWWRDTFFANDRYRGLSSGNSSTPGSKVEMVTLQDGAVRAIESDYFQTCFSEHIDEDVDLVVVELAINDRRFERLAEAYEYLLRALLILPNKPAVINLQTMALSFGQITMGGDLELAVAMYYDTPVINIRNLLLPHIFRASQPSSLLNHYFVQYPNGEPDLRHMGVNGHHVMGDLMVDFTKRVWCDEMRLIEEEERRRLEKMKQHGVSDGQEKLVLGKSDWVSKDFGIPGTEVLEDIPRLRLFQKFDNESQAIPVQPMCSSTTSKKHPLTPLKMDGWKKWTAPHSASKKTYYRSTTPKSTISFAVNVGPVGRVRLTYLRSKTFGLGSSWCWVDVDGVADSEKKYGKRLDGWWNTDGINAGSTTTIAEGIPAGSHVLACRLLEETADPGKGTDFRIIALDST